LGTGGCKLTVINDSGDILAESTKEYITYHPERYSSEQNPDDWYRAFIDGLNDLDNCGKADLNDLEAISFDGSTHNAVLLDCNDKIIRPTIMWTDQRSTREVASLEKEWGKTIFDIGYQKVAPTWTLPQLLWIKNNEPENYGKIHRIMFVKDYIRFLLTESWETDYIEAQGTLLFDMKKSEWSKTLCDIIGLDTCKLPPICKPTDIVGKVSIKASKITGLPAGLPVICGTSDSAIEAYAAGAVRPGQCILKMATAGNVNVMTAEPKPDPLTLTYSHVVPGLWYTVSATNTAASAMRWFRDNFCFEEVEKASRTKRNVYSIIDELIARVPAGSDGLIYHPYLLGERAPYWDPYLRSSFVGATMMHDKAHFLKSLMEGVAFSLKDCYRVIEDMKLEVSDFIIIGGGARSDEWSQIVCDVFGEKIIKPSVSDASYGAALLAGVGAGMFADVKDAINKCSKIEKVYDPNTENKETYNKMFEVYLDIHDKLKDIYKKIKEYTA